MQWVKDMVRTGQDPSTIPFPVNDVVALLTLSVLHRVSK